MLLALAGLGANRFTARRFMKVPDRNEWFFVEHGLPRPHWPAFRGWARAYFGEDPKGEAWAQFVPHWLGRLSAAFGKGYAVADSAHFHLLSQFDKKAAAKLLAWLESARLKLVRSLGDAAGTGGRGKHLVMRFGSDEDYYRYVAYFYEDGVHPTTGGMFLKGPYRHIAIPPARSLEFERMTLAHELTHNLLAHLPLPCWLNEALAMEFEARITERRIETVDRELHRKHRAYWNSETIQRYWMGVSFDRIRSQRLSYNLSCILITNIHQGVRPKPEDLRRFVLQSDYSDAGAAASREQLDLELGDLAASFLGEGDWQPKPEQWGKIRKKIKNEPDVPDDEESVEEEEEVGVANCDDGGKSRGVGDSRRGALSNEPR